MSASFDLDTACALPEDILKKLSVFFNSEKLCLSRHRSTSSEGEASTESSPDTEKPAATEEWMDKQLVKDEKEPESAESARWCRLSWLRECQMFAHSGVDSLLLVGNRKWALLSRSPLNNKAFVISTTVDVRFEGFEDDHELYCGEVFALASSRVSERIDCVCVAVGTSNGAVAFYTESGVLLFVERFGLGSPVRWIKFETAHEQQQLLVLCEHDWFSVPPQHLHKALIDAKTAIAREGRSADELSSELEVACERMILESGESLGPVLSTGHKRPTAFDQYTTASMRGYNNRVERPQLPVYSTFLVSTPRVFANFAWHETGQSDGIWSDAISKIGSNLVPHFGFRKWLGISSGVSQKTWASQRTRRTALSRGRVVDGRQCEQAVASPVMGSTDRQLVAMVDGAARVLLMDVESRQLVRMWKGYRDAQVAWSTAEGVDGQTALFLVIFAPRRGLLEVWNAQTGHRVGAKRVDPSGRLIEAGSEAVLGGHDRCTGVSAVFVRSDGRVSLVVVPFHLALVRHTTCDEHDVAIVASSDAVICSGDAAAVAQLIDSLKTARAKRAVLVRVVAGREEEDGLRSVVEAARRVDTDGAMADVLLRLQHVLDVYARLREANDRSEPSEAMRPDLCSDEAAKLLEKIVIENESDMSSSTFPVSSWMSVFEWGNPANAGALRKLLTDSERVELASFVVRPLLTGRAGRDEWEQMLGDTDSDWDADALYEMLLCELLSGRRDVSGVTVNRLMDEMSRLGEEQWKRAEEMMAESSNMPRVLVLLAVLFGVRRDAAKKTKSAQQENGDVKEDDMEMDGDGEADTSVDKWEEMDSRAETADHVLQLAYAGCVLQRLAERSDGVAEGEAGVKPLTWSGLHSGAATAIREQIASWMVVHRVAVREVRLCLGEKGEDEMEDEEAEPQWPELVELRELLPCTLRGDLVYCDAAWELMSHWFREKRDRVEHFELSVEYLCAISSPRLVHGTARLVWDQFLAESVRVLANAMDKVGRAPSEHEAKKQLDMASTSLPDFLAGCARVLTLLCDSVRDPPDSEEIAVEPWLTAASWSGEEGRVQGGRRVRDSVAQLASKQALVNYHLVRHHLHLVELMRLQMSLCAKWHPLRDGFCSVGRRALFHPLDAHPLIPVDRVDSETEHRRHTLLTKAASSSDSPSERRAARWLATEWGLHIDCIDVLQVVSLLRVGDDAAAGQAMAGVEDVDGLAAAVLRVLAARVSRLARHSDTVMTAQHERLIEAVAGDEAGRVEWHGEWNEAVVSAARLASTLPPQDKADRVRAVVLQYWAIAL